MRLFKSICVQFPITLHKDDDVDIIIAGNNKHYLEENPECNDILLVNP